METLLGIGIGQGRHAEALEGPARDQNAAEGCVVEVRSVDLGGYVHSGEFCQDFVVGQIVEFGIGHRPAVVCRAGRKTGLAAARRLRAAFDDGYFLRSYMFYEVIYDALYYPQIGDLAGVFKTAGIVGGFGITSIGYHIDFDQYLVVGLNDVADGVPGLIYV